MKTLISSLFLIWCAATNAQIIESSTSFYGDGTTTTQGISLISTSDNGFLLVGTKGVGANGTLPITDQWVVKLDENQEVAWEYSADYSSFILDYFVGAAEVSDGYLVLGAFYSQAIFDLLTNVEKLDNDGNLLWSIEFNDSIYDATKFCTIMALEDDGFILGGYTDSIAGSAFSLSEFDSSGNLLWLETYPELGNSNVGIFSYGDILQTEEGDYILAGELNNSPALAKFSSSGELIWNANITVPGGSVAVDILDNDDILLLTTESVYSNPSQDFLVRLDSDGNMISSYEFDYDMVNAVSDMVIDDLGNVFVIGNDQANDVVVLLKTDPDGLSVDWNVSFPGAEDMSGLAVDQMVLLDETHLAFSGSGLIPTTSPSILTVAHMSITYVEFEGPSSIGELEIANQTIIFPNPANDLVNFRVSGNRFQTLNLIIYDAVGRMVATETIRNNKLTWDRDNLPNGAYTYSIQSPDNEFMAVGKLILQ